VAFPCTLHGHDHGSGHDHDHGHDHASWVSQARSK
jgi:hypothetical protein